MSPAHQRSGEVWRLSTVRSAAKLESRAVQPRGRAEVCGQQKQSNDPHNNQHIPQYANYWAPLTRKRHIPPHPAQPPDQP